MAVCSSAVVFVCYFIVNGAEGTFISEGVVGQRPEDVTVEFKRRLINK